MEHRWIKSRRLDAFVAIFSLLLCAATAGHASDVSRGDVASNITTATFHSNALGVDSSFSVLLPLNYKTSTMRYPTLYLLHGYGDDHVSWSLMTNLSAYAAKWNLIVIMPDGKKSFYINSPADPQSRYEDMIVKDLIPYVDSHYRTIPLPGSRAVAGLSMGGYGAAFLGLKHYQTFAALGTFSGALAYARQSLRKDIADPFAGKDDEARKQCDPFALIDNVPAEKMPAIYIACGGQDFLLKQNRDWVDLLSQKKIPYQYHEISPRVHSWDFWDDQVRQYMAFISELKGFEAMKPCR